MKAFCWHGKNDVCYDTVPDPEIGHPRDAVINVSLRYLRLRFAPLRPLYSQHAMR